MPQDGSNNYQYPPGTPGVPDQTIESAKYNAFLEDLVTNDLNIARPVHRGGTGATSANEALFNLSAEKAAQVVTAYLSHLWIPGSFRSAIGATDAPVAGQAFSGVCYISEPLANPPTNQNVTVEARSSTDGKVYVRIKISGTWGAWTVQGGSEADLDIRYVNVTGDTMTGHLTLPTSPAADQAVRKDYVDAADTVINLAVNDKVSKAGDAMTGFLTLHADPDAAMKAASKQYVDAVRTYAAPLDALAYSGMQVNGGFEVSQEVGSSGTSVNGGYFCDGWVISRGGTMATTGSSILSPTTIPGFPNVGMCQVTTAQAVLGASDYSIIQQRIEGYRISQLGWGASNAKSITIAFWSCHSPAGLYSVSIRNNDGNRSYTTTYTQAASGVPQYNVVTIPGDITGAWAIDNTMGIVMAFAQAAGTTFTAPSANTWSAGNYLASPGQINGAAAVNDTMRFGGIIVLSGIHAPTAAQSSLIRRSYDQELITCQRYWQKIVIGWTGDSVATGTYFVNEMFPTIMRAAPTMSGTAFINNGGNFSSPAVSSSSPFYFSGGATASATIGGTAYLISANANARL